MDEEDLIGGEKLINIKENRDKVWGFFKEI